MPTRKHKDAPESLPQPTPEMIQFLAALKALQEEITDLKKRIPEKTEDVPDHIKAELDIEDPRNFLNYGKSVMSARQQLESTMVDWTPTRTDSVCVEGCTYAFLEGQPTRVPQAVVDIIRQSDEQMDYANRLSESLKHIPTMKWEDVK